MGAMRRLFIFVRPYRRWAAFAPLLMVLEVVMDLMQPRLVQRIIDQGVLPLHMPVVLQTGAFMVGASVKLLFWR